MGPGLGVRGGGTRPRAEGGGGGGHQQYTANLVMTNHAAVQISTLHMGRQGWMIQEFEMGGGGGGGATLQVEGGGGGGGYIEFRSWGGGGGGAYFPITP